jgi:acetoin utilization deacetylase AcuC-like enzyme
MSWLKEWDPEVLIVSAGYDALASDLLADMSLEPSDYRQMAEEIKTVFGCRVCFGLEGGYDCHTSAMPAAARATLEAFI